MSEPIIEFYLGAQGGDVNSNYQIEQIWNWKWEHLENAHDYIQWLFPLPEKSAYNPAAPVLNERVIHRFRSTDRLKSNLKRSFEVMLDFYGLRLAELADGQVRVESADSFRERGENWISARKHNHLRLTRILASTRLLGLEQESLALFRCLESIYQERRDEISQATFEFWERAAYGTDRKRSDPSHSAGAKN
jgi:Opioid growth factor receptor (OGFr) conserved region